MILLYFIYLRVDISYRPLLATNTNGAVKGLGFICCKRILLILKLVLPSPLSSPLINVYLGWPFLVFDDQIKG